MLAKKLVVWNIASHVFDFLPTHSSILGQSKICLFTVRNEIYAVSLGTFFHFPRIYYTRSIDCYKVQKMRLRYVLTSILVIQ